VGVLLSLRTIGFYTDKTVHKMMSSQSTVWWRETR